MKEKIKKYWQQYRSIIILFALFVAVSIVLFPYLSPGRALVTNIYPDACSGQWFGADRILGQANTLPESGVESFNSENSAFYRGGDAVIICEGFKGGFNEKKEKFISARLGIALAIDEIKMKESEEVTQPEETPVSGEESSDKEQQKIEENSIPPATTEGKETDNQVQPTEPENQPNQRNEILPPPEQEPVPNPENQSQSENPEQKIDFLPRIKEKFVLAKKQIFNFKNLYQIFPVFAQQEQTSENINQVLPSEPSNEPFLIEVPDETNQPVEDLTPVFLPVEIKTEESTTSTIAQDLLPLDAILNLRYLLEQRTYLLNTFSSYPISPATNNGYFYFDLPEVKSFADLEKVKISFEGLLSGNPDLVAYLDSIWLEVTYEEEPKESPLKVISSFDNNDWEIFVEKDKRIYQITDNNFDDKFPSVADNEIVWQAQINGRWQIFWLNFDEFLAGKTEPTQITKTEYNNLSPKVFANQVVWQAWLDNNWEIMVATKNEDGIWITERITSDPDHDMSPTFLEGNINWRKKISKETKTFQAIKKEDQWEVQEILLQEATL